MNKKTFLKELEEHLIGISKEDKQDILQDYNEHFTQGKADGRKEAEICKALGDPKTIAREVRYELSTKHADIKSELIEAWVAIKRLSIDIFQEARKVVDGVFKTKDSKLSYIVVGILVFFMLIAILSSPLAIIAAVAIAGVLIYQHYKPTAKKTTRLVLTILFNALFFVWFWLSVLFTVLAITVASFALALGGLIAVGISAVYLISYATPLVAPVLWSILFAGIGVAVIGILATWLSKTLILLYFALTKKYIALNKELIA